MSEPTFQLQTYQVVLDPELFSVAWKIRYLAYGYFCWFSQVKIKFSLLCGETDNPTSKGIDVSDCFGLFLGMNR